MTPTKPMTAWPQLRFQDPCLVTQPHEVYDAAVYFFIHSGDYFYPYSYSRKLHIRNF